jgi:phosphotransferase family enzyme
LDTASGRSLLILEDLGPAGNATLVSGCSPAQAEVAIRAIGTLHAAWWQHPRIGETPWLRLGSILSPEQAPVAFRQAWQPFLDKLSPQVRAEAEPAGAWLNLHLSDLLRYMYRDQPYTLIHNDYHPDNLVFAYRTAAVAVLDWQLSTYGHGVLDIASLLGNLNPIDRRAHELRLLQIYHSLLTDSGVRHYPFERCWTDYRLALFYTISRISTAVGLGGIPPTRERQLCDVVFSRYCRSVEELESYRVTDEIPKG